MPVFVSSKSAVGSAHGVFALDQTNAPLVQLTGTSVSCLVGQFPWGPDTQVIEPASPKDRVLMFAPFGMDHTGSGYLSIIRKNWPDLRIIRVVGSGATEAGCGLLQGVTSIIAIEAKYKGAAGNSMIATVGDATDGNPLHFNLTVSVSSFGGITQDLFENLNFSGTGPDSQPDFTKSLLVGQFIKFGAGRPDNGNTTFFGGLDGTPLSSDYVGTQGTGDKGFALAEGDEDIRHIFTDDPGNTLRNSVNAGLQQHVEAMGDRLGYIGGNNGLTLAQTQTDAANYRSTRMVYCDPWVLEADDVDGTLHAIPAKSFAASVAAQLPPSTSIAWKSSEVGAMLNGVSGLVQDRGVGRFQNTTQGIVTMFKFPKGGFRFEADPTTNAPLNPAKKSIRRTRVGDAIAISFKDSISDQVDAPNVPSQQQPILDALTRLLSDLKRNQDRDPAHNFFIKDFSAPVVGSSANEIAQGELELDVDVQVGSAMEQIFLGLNFGETVTITAS